jgi:3-oxoacyl-[acyl-carrier protein] reductase
MKTDPGDRRALILGGSCELGLGLAAAMEGNGLHPVLTYRSDSGRARIDKALSPMAGKYSYLPLDLSRPDAVASLEPALAEGFGYMVDFAQGDLEGLLASADGAAMAPYFEAHITHRAQVIRQVARTMTARRRGRMLYVSSTAAQRPNPGQGFYASAKLASEALYRNVGLELAACGVTTVTLRPGYIDSGRGRRYLGHNADVALSKVPLGRPLAVHEVVETIMFLLSDSAVGFNATQLTMDGGLSAGK